MSQLDQLDPEELSIRIQQGESIKAIADQYEVSPQELLDYCGNPFIYSQEWYDYAYHQNSCNLNRKTFDEARQESRDAGYEARLIKYLSEIKIPSSPIYWLEIGCHLGMTACTVLEKYPNIISVHMIDFSTESVEWCRKYFPYKDRAAIWASSCSDIRVQGVDLSNRYHVVSCLDVTEHLPKTIYFKTIEEIYRVLCPYGLALILQGTYPHPSHINVNKEEQLIEDFVNREFEHLKSIAYREKSTFMHVFRKSRKPITAQPVAGLK